jgi:uridine kinase
MKSINVTVLGETISVPTGTRIQEIADRCADKFKSPVMIAKTGGVMRELRQELTGNTELELFDITNGDGMRVYQRSVVFLMLAAANDVLGNDKQIAIQHSIRKNLYCEIHNYVPAEDDLAKIQNRMHELVKADLPFEKSNFPLEKALDMLKDVGLTDKAELFHFRSTSTINIYKLGSIYNYFYGYMASSTKYLKWFKLIKDAAGFMLLFPAPDSPAEITEFVPAHNISEVFREYTRFGKILRINNVGDLNRTIAQSKLGETIRIAEALHEKKTAHIADMILNRGGVKVILIAGPSSSGKTTFAQRLSIQLRINGIRPYIISLDNYFRNRNEVPLDEYGKPNFESLDFLNTELLNENFNKLLRGEEIDEPKYNFLTGDSETTGKKIRLRDDMIIIAEGIHALNEKTTSFIPRDKKFKIFISSLTALNLDNHNRISTSDTRLLRRMVRDFMTRGASVERTMDMWPSVLKGEREYIFPTQNEADTVFNSSLIYELSVLKQFVEPLLFNIAKDSPLYSESKRLIKFLSSFLGSPTEDIPKTSILREFIGGSCFHV